MAGKTKLELTWIGKNKRESLEPRVLIEDEALSHSAPTPDGLPGLQGNVLIRGDNLLALKALEAEYVGEVDCIYIDPPFNTGEAFENYDDGREHSLWLSMMRSRLKLLYALLRDTGSMFIHIDDNEMAYLIAVCDEIFGRKNRISIITFKQSSVSGPKAKNPGIVSTANYLVYYAKDKSKWKSNRVYRGVSRDPRYGTYIVDFEKGPSKWSFVPLGQVVRAKFGGERNNPVPEEKIEKFVLENRDRVCRLVAVADKDVNADARIALSKSRSSGTVEISPRQELEDYYFYNGQQIAFYRNKSRYIDGKLVTAERVSNIWDDLLSNNVHKEGGVTLRKGKKPEALVKRCLEIASDEGDLILDSFLGSGTTAAVAHKMRRRWIGVELGEQADTHCVKRLRRVVDGSDKDGVTRAVEWQGGGAYRYFRLAPSLLEKDQWGQYVISKEHKPEMLAEAVCKLMGFTYAPSQDHFWRHGHSTENDFIYVTTQRLPHDTLKKLSHEVGDGRTLLVCCRAHDQNTFDNLTVRKIPHAVMAKCEWGRDDYSLNIQEAPAEPITESDLDDDDTVEAAE